MSDAAQISEPKVEEKKEDVSANVNGDVAETKPEGEQTETVSKSKHKRKKSKAKKAAAAAAAAAEFGGERAPAVPEDIVKDGEEKEGDDVPAPQADSEDVKEVTEVKAITDSEEPSTTIAEKSEKFEDVAADVRYIPYTATFQSFE